MTSHDCPPLPDCPTVSVCVPAHGDTESLQHLLETLERVDWPADRLEVVVAVDGPDDRLTAVARARADRVVVLPENRGSYAARNAAIETIAATTDVVVFTDSDVRVTPSWVDAHVTLLRRVELSGGPVQFTTHDPPTPAEFVDSVRHLNQQHNVERLGFSVTANLAVRRCVLDHIRFDASLRSGGDFEFGRRARAEGFSIGFASAAVVTHPARRTPRELLRKVDRLGKGAAHLAAAGFEPEARRDASRRRAVTVAAASGVAPSRAWLVSVAVLDALCTAVYAARVPRVIVPGARRRVARMWRATSRRRDAT